MMLSNDQNVTPNSQNSNCPPKRFLRKGEGLKRFAAYKPPLPTTVKKAERRITFVKFNLDHQKSSSKREPPLHFLPPEILNDDSINLSTEIPKIAPPKIIHTPIRPNRQALGAITNSYPEQDEIYSFNESRINGNIDSLFKKIEHKKSLLEHDNQEYIDSFIESPIDDSGQQVRKQISSTKNVTRSTKQGRPKHLDIDLETDDSACDSNSPTFSKPIVNTLKVGPKLDLSVPISGSCVLALSKRIQKIECTINELKDKIEKCECGISKSPESQQPPTQASTRSRRPLTRAAAKAAKSQPSTNSDKATKSTTSNDKNNRPSAPADNECNSTRKVLNTLVQEISELKSQINTLKLSD